MSRSLHCKYFELNFIATGHGKFKAYFAKFHIYSWIKGGGIASMKIESERGRISAVIPSAQTNNGIRSDFILLVLYLTIL